eukprot:TRINITY_DN1509_c0_g1_i1.p1 TRINITY_DN1509_c0_g1~~TRINITY_DN1509_c0_g1_i1.p1  ORF type:complete len:566 (+),score=121.25 TRINITY_DN1509_c0_g1_i1:250-1698(+)
MANRSIPIEQAKVCGGCGSHNAGMWVQGNPRDFDRYETEYGVQGWSGKTVWETYRKLTDRKDEYGIYIPISTPKPTPLFEALRKGASEKRIPFLPSYNDGVQLGLGVVPSNVLPENWKRVSSFAAFVRPALEKGRKNLFLKTNIEVTRLVFSEDGPSSPGPTRTKRVIGVEYYETNAQLPLTDSMSIPPLPPTKMLRANKEVILCAGALKSPQILMLSGLGDASHLGEFGISAVADLPGVGLNLSDHLFSPIWLGTKKEFPSTKEWIQGNSFGRLDGDYSDAGAIPDYQMIWCARKEYLSFFPQAPGASPEDVGPSGFFGAVAILHPKSKGSVRLVSSDPRDLLKVDPNFFVDPRDVYVHRRAHEEFRRITLTEPMIKEGWVTKEIFPGTSGKALEDFLRASATSMWHPVGTCRMGKDSDDLAVVNSRLKVRKVEGLRVADASVLPELPSGNTHAPSIMVGARAAEMILEETVRLNISQEKK